MTASKDTTEGGVHPGSGASAVECLAEWPWTAGLRSDGIIGAAAPGDAWPTMATRDDWDGRMRRKCDGVRGTDLAARWQGRARGVGVAVIGQHSRLWAFRDKATKAYFVATRPLQRSKSNPSTTDCTGTAAQTVPLVTADYCCVAFFSLSPQDFYAPDFIV